jgi:hypothetical protein
VRPDRFAYDFLGCATLLVLYSRAALLSRSSCRLARLFLACIAYMPVYLGISFVSPYSVCRMPTECRCPWPCTCYGICFPRFRICFYASPSAVDASARAQRTDISYVSMRSAVVRGCGVDVSARAETTRHPRQGTSGGQLSFHSGHRNIAKDLTFSHAKARKY